jgi:hypothetical protein
VVYDINITSYTFLNVRKSVEVQMEDENAAPLTSLLTYAKRS